MHARRPGTGRADRPASQRSAAAVVPAAATAPASASPPASSPASASPLASGQLVHRVEVAGPPPRLRVTAAAVAAYVVAAGVASARRDDVELAVHECLCNAIEHGQLGAVDPPVLVEVIQGPPAAQGRAQVSVRVTDAACGGRWESPVDTARTRPLATRGRGLQLVRACCDTLEVATADGATTVTLHWSITVAET